MSVACRARLPEIVPQRREEVAHRLADALGERALLDLAAGRSGVGPQRRKADVVEQLVRLLGEHRAQRGLAGEPALEGLLFLADAVHHVADDVLVLAAQRAQLGELHGDARLARVEQRPGAGRERGDLGERRRADDLALGRDEPSRQRLLELGQAAPREQRIVAVDLGEQRLLRRNRVDLRAVDAQDARRPVDLARDLGVDRRVGLHAVPEAVDLVQDHEAAGLLRRVGAGEVLGPHLAVGSRHAGIGGQDEQHRVRVGQVRQRELGLGADGVQARRVQDHQALLQQRVREVDDRVAPAGDLDHAARRPAGSGARRFSSSARP